MSDYDPNHVPKKTYVLVGQKAIVLNNKNQLLVLQRSKKSGVGGKWSIPGGALEDKEEPFESIMREIQEETELSVTEVKPFHLRTYRHNDDFILIVGYRSITASENVVLNWEHDSFQWLTREDALKLELTDDARFFIEYFNANL